MSVRDFALPKEFVPEKIRRVARGLVARLPLFHAVGAGNEPGAPALWDGKDRLQSTVGRLDLPRVVKGLYLASHPDALPPEVWRPTAVPVPRKRYSVFQATRATQRLLVADLRELDLDTLASFRAGLEPAPTRRIYTPWQTLAMMTSSAGFHAALFRAQRSMHVNMVIWEGALEWENSPCGEFVLDSAGVPRWTYDVDAQRIAAARRWLSTFGSSKRRKRK